MSEIQDMGAFIYAHRRVQCLMAMDIWRKDYPHITDLTKSHNWVLDSGYCLDSTIKESVKE